MMLQSRKFLKLSSNSVTWVKKLSQNPTCHSERSEESHICASQALRFAQGDRFEIVSYRALNNKAPDSIRGLLIVIV